jgi:hypothetical protein
MKHLQLLSIAVVLLASCQTSPPPAIAPLPSPGTFQRSGQIGLDVTTSKTAYRIGETLQFTVRPSEDCYLAAWIIGADGVTTQIFPNAHERGRVFRKGISARLPGPSPYALRVAPPAGREQLVVVASSTPIPNTQPPPPGIWLKGISVEAPPAPSSPRSALERRGEARVVYDVLP